MRRHATAGLVIALLTGSCHSDSYDTPSVSPLGPFNNADPVQLTFNVERDYWPAWTEDGAGILYQFAQTGHADDDRCIGLVPAAGGTRIWSFCDDRLSQRDSSNSFSAFALRPDGTLLYLEAVGRAGSAAGGVTRIRPDATVLWLADTARPLERRKLLTFPVHIDDSLVTWLQDVAWDGPHRFFALASDFEPTGSICPPYPAVIDSAFYGEMVVRGVIDSIGVTLTQVQGTGGAASYSIAENGASLVITRRGSLDIARVPIDGGAPVVVGTLPAQLNRRVLGVTCRNKTCVVATAAFEKLTMRPFPTSFTCAPPPPPPTPPPPACPRSGDATLWALDLESRQVRVLAGHTLPPAPTWATPKLSPVSNDIVLQIGGSPGLMQLHDCAEPGDLHLFKSLFPEP